MDGQSIVTITAQRSFYVKKTAQNQFKSEFNILTYGKFTQENHTFNQLKDINYQHKCNNYEHDNMTKDNTNSSDYSSIESRLSGRGDNKDSVTNSALGDIEMEVLKRMSQELQTDENSVSSLDSNIKIFKTTVQQILENFYTNLQDFEIYKKKFNEILEKNKGDSVAEMENFIKDIIQHIGSSDSSVARNRGNADELKASDNNLDKNLIEQTIIIEDSKKGTYDVTTKNFQNDNYLTDSMSEQNSSKNDINKKDKSLNLFLPKGFCYIEMKPNDRSLFSEINIRDQFKNIIREPLASTENIKKIKAKKRELQNYIKQHEESHVMDIDIPVKNSYAKKNIYLNEDFFDEDKYESHKFFIFRICNYICRKFRKNSFG